MNILAIDIGNTHIVLGFFEGESLEHTWRIRSDLEGTVDEYALTVQGLFQNSSFSVEKVDRVVICCVVPTLARVFPKLFSKYFDKQAILLESQDIDSIEIHTKDPARVGSDRIVNALAARDLYGAPGIVVDFGTATTFDVISKEGHYDGGVISPGLVAASEALTKKAALLPSLEISEPNSVIGKTTTDSMLSGIVYGYASLVDGIVERIKKEMGAEVEVTATGGLARLMSKYTKNIDRVVPELTLEGLRRIGSNSKPLT